MDTERLIVNSDGSINTINGGPCKDVKTMLGLVEDPNNTAQNDPEKFKGVLGYISKCNDKKWMGQSISGALAIVFGGVAATIAALMLHSPLVLLAVNLGVIALTVGDQVFRVDSNKNKNLARIKDVCDSHGISYEEITHKKSKSKTNTKTKKNDHLVEKELDTPTESMVYSSPLASLGKTFGTNKSMSAPSNEGADTVKLEVPRLDTPSVDVPTSESVVEGIKSNNDDNVKNILAGLKQAHESKTNAPIVEEPATAVVETEGLDGEDKDDTRSAE